MSSAKWRPFYLGPNVLIKVKPCLYVLLMSRDDNVFGVTVMSLSLLNATVTHLCQETAHINNKRILIL